MVNCPWTQKNKLTHTKVSNAAVAQAKSQPKQETLNVFPELQEPNDPLGWLSENLSQNSIAQGFLPALL